MRPERFVTCLFLYAGAILLAQYVFIHPLRADVATLAQLVVVASMLAFGLLRLYSPELEADSPSEYGTLAYSMALLCVLLSGLSFVQFVV